MLGPQIRPVLSAGRFLGEGRNAVVILRDEGGSAPLLWSPSRSERGQKVRDARLQMRPLHVSETEMENAKAKPTSTAVLVTADTRRCS